MDSSDNFSDSSDSITLPASPVNNAASSLFSGTPANLEAIRRQVFKLPAEKAIEMPVDEFNIYWPYIDHLFVTYKSSRTAKKDGKVTKYYACCLFAKNPYKTKVKPRERQRNQTARKPIGCPFKFRISHEAGIVSLCRTSKELHNHKYRKMKFKNSTATRSILAGEVMKGYRSSDIANNIANPQNGNLEALQHAGGSHVTSKIVSNAGRAYRYAHPDHRFKGNNSPALQQVEDAICHLEKSKWLVQKHIRGDSTCIVFAHKDGIKYLTCRGHLTLMDSTHNTNKLKWYLSTLMI
jgi:hypothetical protein